MGKLFSVVKAMWALARAYLLYPAMIGAFLYAYVKDWHWSVGLLIIVTLLYLDPTWRMIWRRIRRNKRR